MPPPTMYRGLLGHFLRGTDTPATNQSSAPPPVRLLTSFSLQAISAAGAGGRGVRGGASDRRSPRNGRGRGGRVEGRNMDREGRTSGEPKAKTRTRMTTATV